MARIQGMEKLIYADASPAPTSRDEAAPEVASARTGDRPQARLSVLR